MQMVEGVIERTTVLLEPEESLYRTTAPHIEPSWPTYKRSAGLDRLCQERTLEASAQVVKQSKHLPLGRRQAIHTRTFERVPPRRG